MENSSSGMSPYSGAPDSRTRSRNAWIWGSSGTARTLVPSAWTVKFDGRREAQQGRVLFRLTGAATLSARAYAADAFVQLNSNPASLASPFATGVFAAVPLAPAEVRRFEAGTPVDELNVGAATFIPATNDPDAARATRFFSGALIFTQRPTDKFSYTISYQGNRHDGAFTDGPGGPLSFNSGNTRTELKGCTHTLNARADLRLGRAQLVTAGYEFERERFINNSFPDSPSGNSAVQVAENSHAFFVRDQIRLLADRLQLSAAFRAQHFTLSAPRFTPAATSPYANFNFNAPPNAYTGDGSLAYLFRATGTKLRGHVGNGYRAPSLFERFGTSFFLGSFSAFGEMRLLIFALVVLLVLLFMPRGLTPWIRDKIETKCPRCKQQNPAWRQSCRICGAALHRPSAAVPQSPR